MEPLYLEFFGLKQSPFNITPDPSFLYLSECHREGLAQLSYGIQGRKGFVVLTGEVGTGKTTLIHALLSDLPDQTHSAFVFSMVVSPVDLLRYICEEFKLIDPRKAPNELHDYLTILNDFLLEKYRLEENCAVIIDEAQNLSAEVLEGVRLLSNFETSRHKLLQILLVGQPELSIRLNAPELRQLRQRVALRHHLRTLTSQECRAYINNRIQVAGGTREVFSPSGLDAIYRFSGGTPRLINILCDNALLTCFAVGKPQVDGIMVGEVADDLSLAASWSPSLSQPRSERVANQKNHGLSRRDNGPINGAKSSKKTNTEINGRKPDVPKAVPEFPLEFVNLATAKLTDAMGPMASTVLSEQMRALGQTTNLNGDSLVALIENVANEIYDDAMRAQFRLKMSEYIRSLQ